MSLHTRYHWLPLTLSDSSLKTGLVSIKYNYIYKIYMKTGLVSMLLTLFITVAVWCWVLSSKTVWVLIIFGRWVRAESRRVQRRALREGRGRSGERKHKIQIFSNFTRTVCCLLLAAHKICIATVPKPETCIPSM